MSKLSPVDVCSVLNISPSTLNRYRNNESMNFPKVYRYDRKSTYFIKEEIDEWRALKKINDVTDKNDHSLRNVHKYVVWEENENSLKDSGKIIVLQGYTHDANLLYYHAMFDIALKSDIKLDMSKCVCSKVTKSSRYNRFGLILVNFSNETYRKIDGFTEVEWEDIDIIDFS